MTQIIAFGYKKGSGKDTCGKFLNTFLKLEAPDLKIKQISFASKLKDISYQLYGWGGLKRGIYYETHRNMKEIMLPQLKLSPRDIWIQLGNKMREIYENSWIDYALHSIKADILIVSDLRFPNEGEAILENDGIVVKINRPNIPQGTDPAEIMLDSWADHQWNHIIENNGTLQDLNNEIEKIAKKLL